MTLKNVLITLNVEAVGLTTTAVYGVGDAKKKKGINQMRKEPWYIRLLKRLGIIVERHANAEEIRAACVKSIQAGICPRDCDRCAWGMMKNGNY